MKKNIIFKNKFGMLVILFGTVYLLLDVYSVFFIPELGLGWADVLVDSALIIGGLIYNWLS